MISQSAPHPTRTTRSARAAAALHDLVTTVAAPTVAMSDACGDMVPGRAEGVLHADVRTLSRNELLLDGETPMPLARHFDGPDAVFVSAVQGAKDPALRLQRRRGVRPGELTETLTLRGLDDQDRDEVVLEVVLESDGSDPGQIKSGTPNEPLSFSDAVSGDTVEFGGEVRCRIEAPGAGLSAEGSLLRLRWAQSLPRGQEIVLRWRLRMSDSGGAVVAPRGAGLPVAEWSQTLTAQADPAYRRRLEPWLTRSLHDLDGMRMATADRPEDAFFAAGAPWYLTLFGRDSLWTARFLLEADWRPAASTLRTLAARQGVREDAAAAEQPGKIMHELRRGTYVMAELTLPPLYFGTIDATALWVCLLHDAWRAGMPEDQVAALLPQLRAALAWVTGAADSDGDGFAEYLDATGHGLANQGWKDSADSVRFHDGRQAEGPIALVEVQGYAHEAAVHGADLLATLGSREDAVEAGRLREWAAGLANRFRQRFWCERDGDRFPALALDAQKRPVDSVTSNIGHLLGTGILSAEEERLVAARLVRPDLDSGLGLRTMATSDHGYSPLSYHCGSVWPHDTAIVIRGLLVGGFTEEARKLAEGLLAVADTLGGRLPELWSGDEQLIPYPAACHPQAWSAAAALIAARALR
ncbi:amylo-alpha-1,6-glucosidase [Enemella dayhoffiae]|uniref:Amylo-alpha-1,6-glucosidase n=1 Tax=Enemella dayhoffiae TaxID=2016507 RepID=A0A255GS36_9ACTN|nr:glycogen debranching N-terminal domain-containing protein [Enemella dayhoffiae]OYO18608.1 amylo-alpha-1,6-glucosidase [Enemella dayhoffiae]